MAENQYGFPTEVLSLPSQGLLYPEDSPLRSGTIDVKYMTAKEEDILTSTNLIAQGKVIERLLESVIVTPNVKLEYSNANTATIEKYSQKNIRGNIGSEAIYNNGLTLSLNYERFQHIDSHRYSHTDSFLIKVGHIIEEDSEFAFNFDPLKNNETSIDYTKNINGFDVKVSSNYSLMSKIPDYSANLEISNTF